MWVRSARGFLAWALYAVAVTAGCTTLAGLDKDYRVVSDASVGSGGSGASDGGFAGSGGSGAGAGAASGSGGSDAGSGGSGGGSGDGSGGAGGSGGGSEICDNGRDDDNDNRVDCFDADCLTASACAGHCSDALILACNATLTSQTTNAAGATQQIGPPDYNCSAGARPGPELAYRYDGLAGADAFLGIYGLDGDLGAFVVEVISSAQCNATNSCISHSDASNGTEPEALAFPTGAGRDYFLIVDGPAAATFNITLHCSTNSTCRPARAIQAGQSIVSSNALGLANVTQNQLNYSCGSGQHSSPEAAFMFTPVVSGSYQIDLTGLGTNLDLFVVRAPNCNTTCLNSNTGSTGPSSGNESITFAAEAHTTYFIIVDGYGISTFNLSVTAL